MIASIRDYEEYLRSEGKSIKTIQSYMLDIRSFVAYIGIFKITTAGQLQRQHFVSYRQHLLNQNYKPATINKAVNSLHSYTDWLISSGKIPAQQPLVRPTQDRIKIANGSENVVEVLEETEIQTLLNYVASPDVSIRDKLIVHFLLYTGARVGELCVTKISSLDLLTGQVKIIGKGGKYREVPLRPDLVAMIQEYLRTTRSESKFASSPYLFVSQRAEYLNRDTVNTILEKLGAACNIHLFPHKLRHTFCTKLISAGVPLITVSKLAGHARIDTTARFYVNTSRQEKEHAVNLL